MQACLATDFFLTIAGGYEPDGNQASLEANVLFFQQILSEKHHGPKRHDVYFADGNDPVADLQVLVEKPAKSTTPATDLLAALHRRRAEQEDDVAYRNHRVPDIAGPLDPKLIRTQLDTLAKTARQGDRLIVYVTAHGSEGSKEDPFNTTIDCWNERKITAREFTGWLEKLPSEVPVVMVMAQCYCGGFGKTIFQDLDDKKGIAKQLRVGFFAQQHDLPAAGCRPDIEHDEEFSSYFWGAITGRSRNGVLIKDSDIDGNGVISFAEAYAHAVIVGETIDIPVRTSDVLLRTYSRLQETPSPQKVGAANSQSKPPSEEDAQSSTKAAPPIAKDVRPTKPFATMTGTLQAFVDRGTPVTGRIVTRLGSTLGFTLKDDVQDVMKAYAEHRRTSRTQARPGRRRPGQGRREFLAEIAEKWPELGDPKTWHKSTLLQLNNQEKLLAELQQLPSWKAYDERQKQRAAASKKAAKDELRSVKFQRLINTLEAITLEQNLALCAPPEIMARYKQILALEGSTLSNAK